MGGVVTMSNRVKILVAMALAALLGAGLALLLTGDGEDGRPSRATTTTATAASTTTTTAATDTSTAVWPFASSSTRYADPLSAARGFATDYLGFVDPVIGEFRQGDARSGEVDIQRNASGPVTTALVRQLGADDSWWILGSATDNIRVTAPTALTGITSPVALAGTSTAFEATVNVQVRQDGSVTPIGEGIVMGGANGTFGPFQGSLAFDPPSAGAGAVVLFTLSAEDGSIVEASVIRVRFA